MTSSTAYMLDQNESALCSDCKRLKVAASTKPLRSNEDVLIYLEHFRSKRQEYFVCLSLDSRQKLIACRVVTIGLLDMSLVHPREVFAGPLVDRAASVIVAHNHPSGEVAPSKEDIKTTQHLMAAGQLLGIPLRDHLIVAESSHYSFSDHCLI